MQQQGTRMNEVVRVELVSHLLITRTLMVIAILWAVSLPIMPLFGVEYRAVVGLFVMWLFVGPLLIVFARYRRFLLVLRSRDVVIARNLYESRTFGFFNRRFDCVSGVSDVSFGRGIICYRIAFGNEVVCRHFSPKKSDADLR